MAPALIQVEAHPYHAQDQLRERFAPLGTKIESWYPLGHGDAGLLNEAIFKRLAVKYGKSPAQIIMRWHIQKGNVVFPGSQNPDHIRENIAIFDFALTDEEMAEIAQLDGRKKYYTTPLAEQEKTFLNFHPAD